MCNGRFTSSMRIFMMIVVFVMMGHLSDEDRRQEHEDKGLQEGHE